MCVADDKANLKNVEFQISLHIVFFNNLPCHVRNACFYNLKVKIMIELWLSVYLLCVLHTKIRVKNIKRLSTLPV